MPLAGADSGSFFWILSIRASQSTSRPSPRSLGWTGLKTIITKTLKILASSDSVPILIGSGKAEAFLKSPATRMNERRLNGLKFFGTRRQNNINLLVPEVDLPFAGNNGIGGIEDEVLNTQLSIPTLEI